MNIDIKLKEQDQQALSELYHFLKDYESKDLKKIELKNGKIKKGEMSGGGPAQGISAILSSTQLGLVQLIKALEAFINLYNKELLLSANGKELSFKGKISEKTILALSTQVFGVAPPKEKKSRAKTKTRKRTTSAKKTAATRKSTAKKSTIAKKASTVKKTTTKAVKSTPRKK